MQWPLTHWSRDKIDAISQTTSSSAFSLMKMFEFRLKFLELTCHCQKDNLVAEWLNLLRQHLMFYNDYITVVGKKSCFGIQILVYGTVETYIYLHMKYLFYNYAKDSHNITQIQKHILRQVFAWQIVGIYVSWYREVRWQNTITHKPEKIVFAWSTMTVGDLRLTMPGHMQA